MKELKQQQKKLQKEMNSIEGKISSEIRAKHYPKIKKQYEGKCFKISNGYNNEERWWLFVKITSIKPDDVYDTGGNGVTSHYTGYSFQTTIANITEIEQIKTGYAHSLENEITEQEFNAEWNKMIERLNKIHSK